MQTRDRVCSKQKTVVETGKEETVANLNDYSEKEMAAEIISALADMYIADEKSKNIEDFKFDIRTMFFMVMGKVAEYLNLGLSFMPADQVDR